MTPGNLDYVAESINEAVNKFQWPGGENPEPLKSQSWKLHPQNNIYKINNTKLLVCYQYLLVHLNMVLR